MNGPMSTMTRGGGADSLGDEQTRAAVKNVSLRFCQTPKRSSRKLHATWAMKEEWLGLGSWPTPGREICIGLIFMLIKSQMQKFMESCVGKTVVSGGMGFVLGGAFGLFMASVCLTSGLAVKASKLAEADLFRCNTTHLCLLIPLPLLSPLYLCDNN